MSKLVRVLIVDDSAYVRKVIREMLSRSPLIVIVGTARDGVEALEMVEQLKPDVVTCDIMMPRLDGVGFVREQMSRFPVPILIVSIASEEGEKALEALEAGAVDFVQKPTALATEQILGIRDELLEKVKAAARASKAILKRTEQVGSVLKPSPRVNGKLDIVVLGISTGGPQALRYLLPQFPANFPLPIAMVLHTPVGYTELYAQKLNELCQIKVAEATEGVEMKPGHAVLARAGRHLSLRRSPLGIVTGHLTTQPFDTPHRPAADVLFQSAAEVYKDRVLGIVMTGMGDDGKLGAAWIKAQGGTVLTESEESCVIYGMPRSVVEAGLSDQSVPLTKMAEAILGRI